MSDWHPGIAGPEAQIAGSKGGKARAAKLSKRQMREIGMKGARISMKKAGLRPVGTEGIRSGRKMRSVIRREDREMAQQARDTAELALDPIAWISHYLNNPETRRPFHLYDAQEKFLREAFTPDPRTIKLKYDTVVFSGPKKLGKTTTSAIAILYVINALGGDNAEGYIVSNSREQAGDRVFADCVRIVNASPKISEGANPRNDLIEFIASKSFIKTVSTEAKSAAGPRPTIVAGDEIWGFTGENAQRLWDEMAPTPTVPVSVRLITTYAGFTGESKLLEGIYHRIFTDANELQEGVTQLGTDLYAKGRTLMYWTHDRVAPWQSEEWAETMRQEYSPNQFARIMENRWVTSESSFIEKDAYDQCVSLSLRPVSKNPRLQVWAAVDASTRKDCTAILTVALDAPDISENKTWLDEARASERAHYNPLVDVMAAMPWKEDHDARTAPMTLSDLRIKLVDHKIIEAGKGRQIDFGIIENYILELRKRFSLQIVCFDPYQMVALAQGLMRLGVPMHELTQTPKHTMEFSGLLRDLVSQTRLRVYDAPDVRSHVLNAVAKESDRGWHIIKRAAGLKIDAAVALAMACYGCALTCGTFAPEESENAGEISDIYAI